jgi:hypothetical protein
LATALHVTVLRLAIKPSCRLLSKCAISTRLSSIKARRLWASLEHALRLLRTGAEAGGAAVWYLELTKSK